MQKRALGHPCVPCLCRGPPTFLLQTVPGADPLPLNPVTQGPYLPLNPDGTVAEPAAPLTGLWISVP